MGLKAYKGFNKDMTCRGFQFKEGETYEEPEAKLCTSGFHACLNPLDCFMYYSPTESQFHEVKLDDVSDERECDTKVCAKKIKIGEKLDVLGICKEHFEFVKSQATNDIEITDNESISARNCSSLAAQDRSSLAAQDWSSLAAGNNSVLAAFNSKAKAGYNSIIVLAKRDDNGNITEWKAGVIDGENMKADTWYKLENGEFVECVECEE